MGWDIHQTWVGARGLIFETAISKGYDKTEDAQARLIIPTRYHVVCKRYLVDIDLCNYVQYSV